MPENENYILPSTTIIPFPEDLLAQVDEYALKVESEYPGTSMKRSGVIRRLLELALRLETEDK